MSADLELVLRLILAGVLGTGIGLQRELSSKPAGVVTGIGFLGAGAIIRGERGLVGGLTTAASIWAVAAIGLAAGAGLYLIAAAAAAITAIVLALPKIRD